jgi:tetratricopeptide (TPR) repeat protein
VPLLFECQCDAVWGLPTLIGRPSVRYERAILRYTSAIDKFGNNNDAKNTEERDLLIPCHLNVAACQLKLGKPGTALGTCEKVLKLDKKNVKGLYRKGCALTDLAEYDDAKSALKECLAIDPKNGPARKAFEKVRERGPLCSVFHHTHALIAHVFGLTNGPRMILNNTCRSRQLLPRRQSSSARSSPECLIRWPQPMTRNTRKQRQPHRPRPRSPPRRQLIRWRRDLHSTIKLLRALTVQYMHM